VFADASNTAGGGEAMTVVGSSCLANFVRYSKSTK